MARDPDKEPDFEPVGRFIGLGLALGIGFGIVYGLTIDNVTYGVGVVGTFGLAAGIALEQLRKNRRK